MGTLTVIAIFVILAYFRVAIQRTLTIIEKKLGNAGPQPRGAIILPEDEVEQIRREHIKKNSEQGKDTPISELQ